MYKQMNKNKKRRFKSGTFKPSKETFYILIYYKRLDWLQQNKKELYTELMLKIIIII